MNYKKFGSKIIVRIDRGEEVVSSLKQVCVENNIKAGIISGIGAANKAEIGVYNPETKAYKKEEITGNNEITSLLGNISEMNGEIYLHLHITLVNEDFKTIGGHLNSAFVGGTLEAVIEVLSGEELNRERDEQIGLNLLAI